MAKQGLTHEEYVIGGVQDYADVMESPDSIWPDEMVWHLDGKTVTEKEFNAAWEHFEKTGERPGWWD